MSSVKDSLSESESERSLLPPKPPGSDGGYVYPITAFPATSAFETSTKLPALVLPAKRTHQIRKHLKSILYSRPRLSIVVEISDEDLDKEDTNATDSNELVLSEANRKQFRKLVLDPDKAGLSVPESPTTDQASIHELLKSLLNDEPDSFRIAHHTITLSYEDRTADEILRRLLKPEGVLEIPGAFEAVGHLAHLNLRHEVLPYKFLIGKVLLDKNSPRIKTVVHKLSSIDTKFRTFGMEVIAGKGMSDGSDTENDNWSDVLVREEGCEYKLDFRKVYWNSRLGGEHRRLVQLIRKDAINRSRPLIVADLMAGIGPFAVPLTARNHTIGNKNSKKGKKSSKNIEVSTPPITVYANDLNPSSYEYLVMNAERNKCDFIQGKIGGSSDDDNTGAYRLHVFNKDGRAFCHALQDKGIFPDHCIMNLPATALEFLDAFRGYPHNAESNTLLPRIHVHCFAPKDIGEAKIEIWKRAEHALGCSLDEDIDKATIYVVRDVSPNKNMYCLSFQLPIGACALTRIDLEGDDDNDQGTDDDGDGTQGESKRPKLE